MPVVRYNGPQVNPQGIPSARVGVEAPIEAFGGGKASVSPALDYAGDAISKIVVQEKNRADQLAFMEADRKLSELQTRTQIGASKMLGKDSAGAPDYAGEEWKKGYEEITKGLANDQQKFLVKRSADNRWESLNKSVQFHVADQLKKFDNDETTSYISAARDSAKLNALDDEQVALNIDRTKAATAAWAERNGVLNTDVHKEREREEVSATHREVVNSRLQAGQDKAAKTYFDEVKAREELTAADLGRLEANVKEGSVRGESQRNASWIMQKYGTDMEAALKQARRLKDPDVQDATVKEVKLRFNEKDQAREQMQESLMQQAADVVEKSHGRPNEDLWMQLDYKQRNALDTRIDRLRRGIQPETDWNKYYYLKEMASTPDTRQEFMKIDLYGEYRNHLDDARFVEMTNLQKALRTGKSSKELDGYRSDKQIVDDGLKAAGYKTWSKAKYEQEKMNLFRRKVDDEIISLQERTGKKANNKDVQEIVDKLLVRGVTERGLIWDTKKRVFELQPGETIEIPGGVTPVSTEGGEIPEVIQAGLVNAIRRRGIPTPAITPAMIDQAYQAYLKQQKGGRAD